MDNYKNGYIGIDLGTTNSCIATSWYTNQGKVEIEVLEIAQRGVSGDINKDKILPSYIYVQKDGNLLVGSGAKELDNKTRSLTGENRALRVFKRDMGKEGAIYQIGSQSFTPVDASAIILEECGKAYNTFRKNRDRLTFNQTPTTITCPACFEKDAKEDTQRAAKSAGFPLENVRMLAEPNSALLYYVYHETDGGFLDLSASKRFITIDLGGGTCDVVIIDVREEKLESGKRNLIFRPVGTPNRGDLGGSDFDKAVAHAFLTYFLGENHIDLDPSSKDYERLLNMLFPLAEKAKESLSNQLTYKIETDLEGRTIRDKDFIDETIKSLDLYQVHYPNLYNGLDFDYELSLEEYLEIVDRFITRKSEKYTTVEEKIASKNLEEIILDTMKDCDCLASDIDYIFFTGGMSYFIPLQIKLCELLGKDEIKLPDHPMTAVAEGAALHTLFKEAELYNRELPMVTTEDYHLSTNKVEKAIRDTKQTISMPTSIGKTYMIEKKDQIPYVLIEKNKEYPIPRTRINDEFKITNGNGIIINIFIGTSQYNSDIEKARSAELRFDEPKEVGTSFFIDYEINESGSPIFYIVFGENEEYKIGGVENE